MELFRQTPLPPNELVTNLGLYLRSTMIAKILYLDELYRQVLPLPGVIMEFGCWWGSNLALFSSLRAVHEPYNYTRRVIGFDTFSGYQSVSELDGASPFVTQGAYTVGPNYLPHLEAVLDCHEIENPMAQVRKYELVPGDVTLTVPEYFQQHPECVVALAYLDMQLYEPTKAALQGILPHLVPGSVVAIDELNCPDYPGETQAVAEVLGFQRHRYLRLPVPPGSDLRRDRVRCGKRTTSGGYLAQTRTGLAAERATLVGACLRPHADPGTAQRADAACLFRRPGRREIRPDRLGGPGCPRPDARPE